MTLNIPLYKRKPTTSVKEENRVEKAVDDIVKEKAKVATDAAIEHVEKKAKDSIEPIKKLAAAIGLAGGITIFILSGKTHKTGKAATNIYIYGSHCTVNVA